MEQSFCRKGRQGQSHDNEKTSFIAAALGVFLQDW
jgi:hypothetical protein